MNNPRALYLTLGAPSDSAGQNRLMMRVIMIGVALLLVQFGASTALAQMDPIALDSANNTAYAGGSWANGSNGGFGFQPWTINMIGGDWRGSYAGNPAEKGIQASMPNPSWGMYAHTGAGNGVTATRAFNQAMNVGDVLSFKWAFNWDSGSTPGKGIKVFAGATQVIDINNAGNANITVNGVNTGFGYGTVAMTWTIERINATQLTISANDRDGAGTYTVTINAGAPTSIQFYINRQSDSNGNREPFFNDLRIQPTIKFNQSGVSGSLGSSTVTFPSTTTVTASGGQGTGAYAFRQNGGSGAVSFSGSGASRTITPTTAGTAVIEVRKLGDNNYNDSAWVSAGTLTINKGNPSVSSWPSATPITLGQTLAQSSLVGGSATPAGQFDWTDDTIEPESVGSFPFSVTYTPTDTVNYNTAQNNVNLTINAPDKVDPDVTEWPTASAITYGQSLADSELSGGEASVDGYFEWSNESAIPMVGAPPQSVTFYPDDDLLYNTVIGAVAITVNKADPVVTEWPTASAITYGQSLADSELSGGESTPAGTFDWTDDSVEPDIGTAPQSVTFTPTDTANFNNAVDTVNVTVNKATPTIITPPTAGILLVGQSLADSELTGGEASVPGSFDWTDDTIEPERGTEDQSVTFTPSDTTRYNDVIFDVSVSTWQDALTFYAKSPAWADNNPHDPQVWGPFVGEGWSGHTMTYNAEAEWWSVAVEVDDATAAITYQWRFAEGGSTKYQKRSGDMGQDPIFTTTTGEIWIDGSDDASFVWSEGNDFYLIVGKVTESQPKEDAIVTLDNLNQTYDGSPKSVSVTTDPPGLTVVVTYDASETIPTDAGSYAVVATVVDDGYAGSASDTLIIAKATPTITTPPTASAITYGDTLAESDLTDGVASVPGEFDWTNDALVPVAGTADQSVTFTPTDNANYNEVIFDVSVTVNKATPTVTTPPTATSITIGDTLAASSLIGGAAIPSGGTFYWTDDTIEPDEVGTFAYGVTYTPLAADLDNYLTTEIQVNVTIDEIVKEDPVITVWPTASAITYGQTLASSELDGGEVDVDGTFYWVNDTTAPNAGTANHDVVFTPDDTESYNVKYGSVSVTVNKADPVVTEWPTAAPITYGQTLASSGLSGGSATPAGSFDWTDDSIAPDVGTASQSVTYTPTDTANYNSAVDTVDVTVDKATPTITTPPTASRIVAGQALAESDLSGGAASVPGDFDWTDDSVIPAAGVTDQSVTFTPTDNVRYNEVVFDVSVTTWADIVTFYARVPAWVDHDPENPGVWGPFVESAGWSGHTMTYDAELGWWTVEVEVDDATAEIAYQLRFDEGGVTKYQKRTDDMGADPIFTTTTREIWIDASQDAYITWSEGNDFFLQDGRVTESEPSFDVVTFYARVPAWADHDPHDPEIWGPFIGASWYGHTMTYDAELGWWSVAVEVLDAEAELTYQLRFAEAGATKYQHATGDETFSVDPTFSTTTGEIWLDAVAEASFVWSEGDGFYLVAGKVTETKPKEDQTITFEEGAWQTRTYGDAAFDLVASASSGLEVSFESLNTAVATISGNTVTIVGAGEATIRATQTGDDEFNAAEPVDRVLTVSKATATVQLDNLEQIYDGDTKPVTVTTIPADLTVTITYDALETVPSVIGTYAVVATVVDDNYEGSASDTLEILPIPIETVFKDWLESVMGQDSDDPNFATDADYDEDGATTWEEFLADTDPADANSVFKGVGSVVSDEQSLTFPSSANRMYSLYYAEDIMDPEWEPVVTGVPGTGEDMTLTDPVERGRVIYRLKVEVLP